MKTYDLKLSSFIDSELNKYAAIWGVARGEALGRLIGLGAFVAEELQKNNTLYSEDEASLTRLHFPELEEK